MKKLKRFWSAATIDSGLFLGIVLLMGVCLSATFFVKGGNAYDELPKATRIHMEDCALAHRKLGPDVYERRQDCLDVLPPVAAAKTR